MPPRSVVIRLSPGNDDIVGRRVRKEIFGGRGRMEIGDAIHLNTMIKNKITNIVTDDRHFDNLQDITRIDLLKEY